MRLLVTNDDGIDSVFLHEFVRAVRAAGHTVWVVAPKQEQSWIGKAMSRTRPVHAEQLECRAGPPAVPAGQGSRSGGPSPLNRPDPANRKATFGLRLRSGQGDAALQGTPGFGCPAWVVDGTPSDCVNIALHHLLPEKPDGVVSGPNIGCNAGLPFILGSGTIAGAVEATLHGFPAVAVSQDLTVETFDAIKSAHGQPGEAVLSTLRVSCRRAAQLLPELLDSGLGVQSSGSGKPASGQPTLDFRPSTLVHNLNFPFPCTPETEMRRTVPARVLIGPLFSPALSDGAHRFRFGFGEEIPPPPPAPGLPPPLSDQACLAQGHISHTVLDYGRLGAI